METESKVKLEMVMRELLDISLNATNRCDRINAARTYLMYEQHMSDVGVESETRIDLLVKQVDVLHARLQRLVEHLSNPDRVTYKATTVIKP